VTCALSALFQADLDREVAGVAEMKTHERVGERVLMVRRGGVGEEKGITETRHCNSSGIQNLPFIPESDTSLHAETQNII
jgi:hypothetical protein